MDYSFELPNWHIMPSNFKEKVANIIVNTISGSPRFSKFMNFNSFAQMTFKDPDVEKYPIITTQDQFNRLKTNCLVFDLNENTINKGFYDKCFIYCHVNGKEMTNFRIIYYNTKNNKIRHDNYISPEYDEITRHLMQEFFYWKDKEIYDYYSLKHDCIHGLNGHTMDECPTEVQLIQLKENRRKRFAAA